MDKAADKTVAEDREEESSEKRPYSKPAIVEEVEFDVLALGCDEATGGRGGCPNPLNSP